MLAGKFPREYLPISTFRAPWAGVKTHTAAIASRIERRVTKRATKLHCINFFAVLGMVQVLLTIVAVHCGDDTVVSAKRKRSKTGGHCVVCS